MPVRVLHSYLVQNRMVDVLVTTAGGIEEDFIKCMGHTYVGDFALKGERYEWHASLWGTLRLRVRWGGWGGACRQQHAG